ncbi:MAG: hypothetical protein ACE5GS_14695 [Kiloniellaceae bacterium]
MSAPADAPAGAPARGHRFSLEMFDEDNRPGRPVAPLAEPAPEAPAAGSRDLGVDLDRWEPNRPDDAPEVELGWADLLDVINPLQHIPLISNLYRALTGDEISAPARIAGGALFGGPVGFVAGIANAIAAEANGADPGDTALAALFGGGEAPATQVADAPAPTADAVRETAPTPQAAAPALTGRAALGAFASDLRSLGSAVRAMPTATSAAADLEPPTGADRAVTKDRAGESPMPGAAPPAHAFTARMLRGLDKYRAMALERGGGGRPAPRQVDRTL